MPDAVRPHDIEPPTARERTDLASDRRWARRCLLTGLLVVLSGVAVCVWAEESGQVPVRELRLDNGMRFLLVERPQSSTVAAGWAARVGSADERPGESGVSHLIEHLMFKGTTTIGNQLPLLYAENGAVELNAHTFEDLTLFFVTVPAEKLELWFWLESDRLLHPTLGHLDREKNIVLEERRMRVGSTPTGELEEKLRALFWQGHPYARPPIGRASEVAELERKAAKRHFDTYYRAHNLTAALVGNLDPEEVEKLARRYFGRLPESDAGSAPTEGPGASLAEEKKRLEAVCQCRPRAEILYRTVPFGHPDTSALELLAGLLNGRTGRLHRSLVLEQELAFSAYVLQHALRRAGYFSFWGEAKGEATAVDLVAAWDRELERLRRQPVPTGELQKVKNQVIADAFRRLEEPGALMKQLLVYDALGDWRYLNLWSRRMLAVEAEDVQRVVAKYFHDSGRAVGLYRAASGQPSPEHDRGE